MSERAQRWWLSLVLEMSPSLEGAGLLSELDIEFDNGNGGMGELGMLWVTHKA